MKKLIHRLIHIVIHTLSTALSTCPQVIHREKPRAVSSTFPGVLVLGNTSIANVSPYCPLLSDFPLATLSGSFVFLLLHAYNILFVKRLYTTLQKKFSIEREGVIGRSYSFREGEGVMANRTIRVNAG